VTQRFVATSPDGSRDALYERRSALSRDLLGDNQKDQADGKELKRRFFHRAVQTRGNRSRRVRPPELVLGIIFVVGGAFVATTLAGTRTETVEVIGAARTIDRGHALVQEDLAAISVERPLAGAFVSVAEAKQFIGKIAASSIAGGSPIVRGMLAEIPALQEDEAIVPIRLETGDVPQSIAPGDSVRIALVPDSSLSTDTLATEFSSIATVWNVEEPSEQVPDFVISLKAPHDLLLALVTAQKVKIAVVSAAEEQPS
jgi:hypothetical protein